MNKDQQNEAKQLLAAAHSEITNLRARIDELQPKADAFDVMREFSRHMNHDHGGFATVDPSWQIKRFLDELEKPKPSAVAE